MSATWWKTPAQDAGIKRGDVIVEFDGEEVPGADQLPRMVASRKPGDEVDVKVVRDGEPMTIRMKLGKMESEQPAAEAVRSSANLGMEVENITPELAKRLGMESADGVVITKVSPNSPAMAAGLKAGYVIVEVNRQEVKGIDDYESALTGAKPGDTVLLLVRSGDRTSYIGLKVPEEK